MAFSDYDAFLEAKKRMDTLELRKADNSLTVDEAYRQLLAIKVREERNILIAATDFRVLPDAPWDVAPWITYRAALRDITEQSTFPESVNWPVPPSDS
tara:strand:+ start:786 stop:1079 length:294 start_codon:yes stop_codon:yes gene_type:complete